jgi:PAT family beta-lactamase induction signal transducer AmpG
MLLLPRLIGGYSGVMVERFGYHTFFLITAVLGLPTLVMIALQWSQEARRAKAVQVSEAIETPVSEQP